MTKDKRTNGRKNQCVGHNWSVDKLTKRYKKYVDNGNSEHVSVVTDLSSPAPYTPCFQWKGSTQNGYAVVSRGHGKSKLRVHILSARLKHGRFPDHSEVTSHLCHNKLCVNPDHLVIEKIKANNARIGCIGYFEDDDTGNVFCVCQHSPRCLVRDAVNFTGQEPFKLEVVPK